MKSRAHWVPRPSRNPNIKASLEQDDITKRWFHALSYLQEDGRYSEPIRFTGSNPPSAAEIAQHKREAERANT
jgi:hypothetical protein